MSLALLGVCQPYFCVVFSVVQGAGSCSVLPQGWHNEGLLRPHLKRRVHHQSQGGQDMNTSTSWQGPWQSVASKVKMLVTETTHSVFSIRDSGYVFVCSCVCVINSR